MRQLFMFLVDKMPIEKEEVDEDPCKGAYFLVLERIRLSGSGFRIFLPKIHSALQTVLLSLCCGLGWCSHVNKKDAHLPYYLVWFHHYV